LAWGDFADTMMTVSCYPGTFRGIAVFPSPVSTETREKLLF